MIEVHADPHSMRLEVRAPSRLADIIGRISGLKVDAQAGCWAGPITPQVMLAVANDLGKLSGFTPTPEANSLMSGIQAVRASVLNVKREGAAVQDPRLFDYQAVGVWMLLNRKRVLLGDEMGTGKTVMALTAARQVGGAALVVCPNSMKHRWADEAAVWYPEAQSFVVQGTAKQKEAAVAAAAAADGPVVVVTNWESLRTLSRVAGYGSQKLSDSERAPGPLNGIRWDVVVADEAHRAKDPNSKQTRALWAVAGDAEYRWALTGTPVLNTPGDLWAIGRFYDPATYGDSRHKWHNSYVAYIETNWGPKDIGLRQDRKDLFEAWFDMNFVRRTKDEVLDLPPVTYQTRTVELHQKQRTAYNRMVKDLIVAIDDGILVATDPLALLIRLSQIASATPVVNDAGDVVALDTPSNKITALFEVLDELGEDRPVAVFAQSRKLVELACSELDRKGISTAMITGAVDPALREANVQRFQRGDARVALVTLGAGSEGINLFAADTAVFLQRSYSFGQSLQAEARIHRIGQESDHVTIIDLVSEDTVDEAVIEALRSKGEMSEQVLRDQARALLEQRV